MLIRMFSKFQFIGRFGVMLGVVVLLGMPLRVIAGEIQMNEIEAKDACAQATFDATRDVNRTLWFGAGCLFGVIGVGAAYLYQPGPPARRLVGKPLEWSASYVHCYKRCVKRLQMKNATDGWCLSVLWNFPLLFVIL